MKDDFLECTKYVDYDNELIMNKCRELYRSGMTDVEKAETAYIFVRDEIPHAFDKIVHHITATASDTLRYRTGTCHAKSNLYAALLRHEGIRTGFCFEHITLLDDDRRGYCLHSYNAVWLQDKWVLLDVRGNKKGINAQFSLDEPKLAYPPRPEYDEYFFEGVHAKPDMPTMNLLENSKRLIDIINNITEFPHLEGTD